MYFNHPDLFMNGVGLHERLNAADVQVRIYLCRLRVNPCVYKELMQSMESGSKLVCYPTLRSEIGTFNIRDDQRFFQIDCGFGGFYNLQRRCDQRPFCFLNVSLTSIRQLAIGEEYSYETLKLMNRGNGHKDLAGISDIYKPLKVFAEAKETWSD